MNNTKKLVDRINRIVELISTWGGLIAGILTLIMMVALVRETVGRYLFNAPTAWALTLCEFLLVGLAYLGGAYTFLAEGHVRVDIIYNRYKPRTKAIVDIIVSIIMLCYLSMIVWQSWGYALHSLDKGFKTSGAVQWYLFPPQILVPIGSGLFAILLLTRLYQSIARLCEMKK